MQLNKGDPAPHFQVQSPGRPAISPSTYAGKRLWLILSRYAACPFCSLRLDRVARRYDEIAAAEVEILVVFPSPFERVEKFAEQFQPQFTVASDFHGAVFRAYGAENSWAGEWKSASNLPKIAQAIGTAKLFPFPVDGAMHQMPAEFLISPTSTISDLHYGREMDDGFPIGRVLEWASPLDRNAQGNRGHTGQPK